MDAVKGILGPSLYEPLPSSTRLQQITQLAGDHHRQADDEGDAWPFGRRKRLHEDGEQVDRQAQGHHRRGEQPEDAVEEAVRHRKEDKAQHGYTR